MGDFLAGAFVVQSCSLRFRTRNLCAQRAMSLGRIYCGLSLEPAQLSPNFSGCVQSMSPVSSGWPEWDLATFACGCAALRSNLHYSLWRALIPARLLLWLRSTAKFDQEKYGDILIDFRYIDKQEYYEAKMSEDPVRKPPFSLGASPSSRALARTDDGTVSCPPGGALISGCARIRTAGSVCA